MADSIPTIRQKIMNLIHDLEPEDAIQIARNIIDSTDALAVIWVRDDLISHLYEYHNDADLSDEEVGRIADAAMSTYDWRALGDCSDADWEKVKSAAYEGASIAGIDLNRNDG